MNRDVPGLDLGRLTTYLAGHLPLDGTVRAEVIAGGRSNLTYRLSDGERTWVLRRPPLGHVLPSAHDMAREHRILSALAGTGVPVPRVLLLCEDTEVTGAPFYVMEYVEGEVLRTGAQLARLTPEQAARCGHLLVEVLLRLHAVDPEAVGLEDFGRPEGYLKRQVDRWRRQWQASQTRPLPLLEEVAERLARTVPDSPAAAIVHGDYRLDNVMYGPGYAEIVAVLDWEMATLGDPLADLGVMVAYHELAESGESLTMPPLPTGSGFPTSRELLARYAAASPLPLERVDWYVAFAYYKLAIIAEGIHARHLQGKTVGAGFETMGAHVPALVERAHARLASS